MFIGHVELPVKDPLVSLAYYVMTLEFELTANQADTFVWIKKGSIELLLRPGVPHPGPSAHDGVNLVLYSDDLRADVARLEARGVTFELADNCYQFRDPDGYWWQLVDPQADHAGGGSAEGSPASGGSA